MNSLLNYLIEANLGLLSFYVLYWILFRNENQFAFKRAFLLVSIIASLLFPVISIPSESVPLIPTLGFSQSSHWLPEIIIFSNTNHPLDETQIFSWQWMIYLYLAGLILFFILFFIRIASLILLFKSSKKYNWKNYLVAESEKEHGSFSFFRFIFLGQVNKLTEPEKQEILNHEEVHAEKIHSLDIVIMNMLRIVFWFNPVLHFYQKSLVQIHEYEADARSVEGREVNAYCNLLARVALQTNGYTIANHFTNSLILKRINMMKTVQKKIKHWKVAMAAISVMLIFFVVACQDQVMQDIQAITDNSSAATLLPEKVEAELAKLRQSNPKAEYIVMEMNEEGKKKLEELDKNEDFNKNIISMSVIKTEDQSFVILQKGDKTDMLSEMTAKEGEVFTIVEEIAAPIGGYPVLYEYIAKNIKYPLEARNKGIEGKVFIEFIVNDNGTLSDFAAIKGIGAGCDEEAVQILKNCPISWNPAKQRGKSVRQRLVIPVTFKLGEGNPASIIIGDAQNSNLEFSLSFNKEIINGTTRLNGQVKNENGTPLTGANIVVQGTTTGTVANKDGSFQLNVPTGSGIIVVSFVGYKTKTASF